MKGGGLAEKEEIVQWEKDLYYGSSQDYLVAIQNTEHTTDTVMLVGHNPKMEDIARRLCGNGSVRMPTAGLACLEQPANSWDQIREGMASVKWMMIPKLLDKFNS
jgi:phosphohistidine phosphatase